MLLLVGWMFCPQLVYGQEPVIELETTTVVSSRYPTVEEGGGGFSTTSINQEELGSAPQARLDDVIRSIVPGFSLFRRSSSATANPTTQGASLRNLGPNGAGRTLVLLDGVPQNDPFGGWVYWQRLPPGLLGNVTVVQGGGAGLFGNNALGGTIYLSRRNGHTVSASLMGGERETAEGVLLLSSAWGNWEVDAALQAQHTGGHPVVREDQRGPVDIDADSRSMLFESGVATTLESGVRVSVRASWFEEERGNGTPLTGNRSEALDLSLGIRGPEGEVQWEGLLYFQDRRFESTFSSVNEERTMEVPALDQYAVPAHSLGFSFTTTFVGGLPMAGAGRDESKLIVGVDGRWIEGETRERFRFDDGGFLNEREAGGMQSFFGVFAEQNWAMGEDVKVTLGGRADYWSVTDGRRVERVRSTGATFLDESFDDRDGVATNGRLGISWDALDRLTLRAAGYSGFRVPTLNELYRPFRVRNDVTGANDELEPEKLLGAEAGMEWRPVEEVKLGAVLFWNRLNDAVANVTVLEGPGTAPDGTMIPAGGVFRQRQNVESVTTRGLELSGQWQALDHLKMSLAYLFTNTELRDSSSQLDGRELAQAPAHVVTGAVAWRPHKQWEAVLQARYGSEQFEDDLNSITLESYVVWDAALNYQMTQQLSVGLVVENVFDRMVETGRSADGVVSIGAPRWVGLRMKWDW
ncbi:TonB-dependent receptor plug domain-containing protein [Phragmitibacter flavus]|uniref:TonB-dependent receptor plug domain-containing protein n=1 Tax=Phragmitibacter flavus TaxID=2576071 RepID=UPI00197EC2C2|nr:TonB-dependent receptor [Phragmitibacter flavus]